MIAPQDCQQEACAIQTCLSQHNYQESKCASTVEALYKCCDAMYAATEKSGKQAGDTGSTACPVREVLKRRMKDMAKGR